MRSLFTLIFIAVFIAVALRHHYAAMLMYWWFGVFRPHEWIYWDVSSLRLPLIATLVFLCPLLLKSKIPSLGNPVSKMIILFLGLAILSAWSAGCLYPSPVSTITVFTLVIVTLFSSMLLTTYWHFIVFLAVVGVSLFFHSAKTGLVATLSGYSLYDVNIGGGGFTGSNAMALGTAMGMFFIILAIQCLARPRVKELLPFLYNRSQIVKACSIGLVVSVVGGVVFIAGTGSRGSSLALLVGIAFWVLMHPKRIKLSMGLIVAIVLAVSTFGIPTSWKERVETAFVEQSELDNSAASRPHFWKVAQLMVKEHPLGIGTGCFKSYYDEFDTSSGQYGNFRSVHSSHFAILAEIGYMGALVWVLILLKCILILLLIRKQHIKNIATCNKAWFFVSTSSALLCSLLVFIVGGSFYEMPYNDFTWVIFSCVIALTTFSNSNSNSNSQKVDAKY